jgi:hypothetical protein
MAVPAVSLVAWVVISFAVVIVGSVALGRWLQRKGSEWGRHKD